MDRIQERIIILFPSLAEHLPGVTLVDRNDGNGTVIDSWDAASIGGEKPTDAELLAVTLPDLTEARRALIRTKASELLDLDETDTTLLRALTLVIMDELNNLRQWITSFKAATAAATNLANLQTRVAALANTPDRIKSQIITAIKNKIDSGNADTST
jgi:hypothetical protein